MQYQKLKVFGALLRVDAVVKAEVAGRYVADKGLLLNQAILEKRVFKIDELKLAAYDPTSNVAYLAVPDSEKRILLEVDLQKFLRATGKSVNELDARLMPQEVEVFVSDKKQDSPGNSQS